MTAAETIVRQLRGRRTGAAKWVARCPAHDDRSPSLTITERDGRVLVHCHTGCPQSDVITALRSRGLWPRQEWTPKERRQWAEERHRVEQQLPEAQYWRRAAVQLADAVLEKLKAALFDPTLPWPETNEIYRVEQLLGRFGRIDDAELVTEYEWWRRHYPHTTAAMVRAAREVEQTEIQALRQFLGYLPEGVSHDQTAA